jgi:hypothetical protein
VIARLLEAGIESRQIADLGGDTLSQNELHHSYRAARRAGFEHCGHNVAAVMLD